MNNLEVYVVDARIRSFDCPEVWPAKMFVLVNATSSDRGGLRIVLNSDAIRGRFQVVGTIEDERVFLYYNSDDVPFDDMFTMLVDAVTRAVK